MKITTPLSSASERHTDFEAGQKLRPLPREMHTIKFIESIRYVMTRANERNRSIDNRSVTIIAQFAAADNGMGVKS